MFRRTSLIKNKPYRSLKARSKRYMKNSDEPNDKPSRDSAIKVEQVLHEDSLVMRRRFRQIAHRIRVIKIHGIKKNS